MGRVIGRLGIGLCVLTFALILTARAVGSLVHTPLLAYSSEGDIYVRDLGYDLTLQLTFDSQRYIDELPAWSADGRALAFTRRLGPPYSVEDPDTDIYWMPLNGLRRVRLTDNTINDTVPSWSPDGRFIAYLSMEERGHQVKLIAPEATESGAQVLPIALPQNLHTTLRWTPDGSQLLLHTLNGKDLRPMAFDFASQTLTPLSPYESYYPAPSPNGERIAALFPTRGGHALAVLTGDILPRLLTESLPPRVGVVWEDDAHLLYLSDDLKAILRVNVQTGQTTEAYRFANHVMSFAVLP